MDWWSDEKAEEKSDILLKERYELLKWASNVEMRTPNLMIPMQIANYVESLPFCKLAVSPKCDRVALMSYARLLDIYNINGEILEHESSVQVLEETSPEYCLLQFTSSGSLLLSSRSTPHIDVFDNMGAYCYDIPLEAHEGIFDVNSAICGMQTVANESVMTNDKQPEILYVLQYSGTFSAFKIGRLSKYTKMWSVNLDIGQTGSFVVTPKDNFLFVASHYTESASVSPPAGLCTFRIVDSEPYVEPFRISTQDSNVGWFSRLPFSTSSMSYLPKIAISHDSKLLLAVSTSGSLYLFEIPSVDAKFVFKYISGPKPIEACFVDVEEIAIIYDNGVLLRCGLDDIEEKMYSVKMRNKKELDEPDQKDVYNGQTIMVSPAKREIFLLSAEGDSAVLREAAHRRVQLAGQLWFHTIWNSLKKMAGMAMGESAEPLQMATHVARFEFSLVHSPTRTLEELFNRTLIEHDYERARELAESYDSIDINIVMKSEWLDKCSKSKVKTEDVEGILAKIRDFEWVAEQCVNVDVEDFEVQKALIDLGLSLSTSSISWKIRLLHHLRILEVCRVNDDMEGYLRARNRSCLDAALNFAHNGDLDSLLRIVESNMPVLKKHQRRILSAIPSCIYPTKYEHFFPKMNNGQFLQWELEEERSNILDRMNELLVENPDAGILVKGVNVGDLEDEEAIDFVQWIRETLNKIDFECGMTSNCISLLSIAIERGFEELKEDMPKWELYMSYISICSSVSESIISFQDSTVKSLIDRFSRLLESELIKNAQSIIPLIEWKVKSTTDEASELREAIISLMKQTNERSTKVLVAFREHRPDLIDDQVILECLLNMTSTGADLLQSIGSLPIDKYSNVTSSLGSLMSRGVKMTFKSIFESMKEPDGARRVLIKLSRSGHCESLEDWSSLKDDIVGMAQGIYGDLVTVEEALELFAREVLEHERIGQREELMSLVLTMKKNEPPNPKKLDAMKSAEVLLAKSDELMSEATHKDDPLLGKSRFFAVAARSISPEEAKMKLKWLDAIELAQELGCTMMPIAIKLSDHDALLHDIVHNGSNYKQGKKLATLAVLLDIDTPVATALSYCALAALNNNDATYLSRYIGEVMKARELPVVHHLCMKIMDSKHVPTDMEDIYSCAMLNCTEETLLQTVDAITESEKRINEMKKTKLVDLNDIPICEHFVHDPMYTPVDIYNSRNSSAAATAVKKSMKGIRKTGKDLGIEEMRRIMAHESSNLALCYSLFADREENENGDEDKADEEEETWTKNDKLKRYEKSLHHFEKKYPLDLIIRIPPSTLIHEANLNDVTITAIDRIEDYGCDKNRFIGDKEYRDDAIVGLAMTENEQQFEDALELAQKYGVDEWQLHMASLENAITSLSIAEVKRILKCRGHLAKLRTRIDEFHVALRSSVLPLLGTNEQFIAYTTLFGENEAEKKVAPVFKKILEKRRDVKTTKMWSDAKYLSGVLVSIPDKILGSISETIQLIPIGVEACEITARTLLDGTEMRPPASPQTLFMLLRKDVEEFLELVAVKSRDDEIQYLERSLVLLEAVPTSPEVLVKAVRERVEKMKRSTVTPEQSANSSTSSGFAPLQGFSNNDSNSGMMKRRKI